MRLGEAYIEIKANLTKLVVGLRQAEGKMRNAGAKMARVFARAFGSALRTATRLAKWGAIAVGGLVVAMTKLGMDAVESESLFSVSMGKMAESARKWSEELQRDLGLNAFQIRNQVASFNVMLKSMGQTEQGAYDMSKGLVQLAHDMASFYNLNPVEAFDKLRAGIVGEVEPLRRLGIVLSAEAVKAHAFAEGIAKGTKELSDSEKILARYSLILARTTAAQGDLARTSESAMNQWRRLKASVVSLMTEMGTEKTVPVFTSIVKSLNEWVTVNDELIKQKFGEWAEATKKAMAVIPIWWEATGKQTFGQIADALAHFGRVMAHTMRFYGMAPQLGVEEESARAGYEQARKRTRIYETLESVMAATGGGGFRKGGALDRAKQRWINRARSEWDRMGAAQRARRTTPLPPQIPWEFAGAAGRPPMIGGAVAADEGKGSIVKAIQDQTDALIGKGAFNKPPGYRP